MRLTSFTAGPTTVKSRRSLLPMVPESTQPGDAASPVHRRPHDREVEAVVAADVAVEHLADMQAEIRLGVRQAGAAAAFVQRPDARPHRRLGPECAGAGLARIADREDRERPVADELEHVASGLGHARDDGLGVIVEERDDLARVGRFGQAREAAQIAEPWWGRVIFYVRDVDAAHERALAAGYRPTNPPRDAEWGECYFHLTDPDGHELSFARPLPSQACSHRGQLTIGRLDYFG